MTNYWPFEYNPNDVLGEADLFGGCNVTYINDRFNKPQAALSITNGYYKIPSKAYLSSSFSVLVWVRLKVINKWARIFEFGNGLSYDNIVVSFNSGTTGGIYAAMLDKSLITLEMYTNIKFTLNKWQHVAFVLNYTTFLIYLDGNQMINQTCSKIMPNNLIRNVNFLGRSSVYPSDQDANADYDELKIFNRALTQNEINFEMNNELFI